MEVAWEVYDAVLRPTDRVSKFVVFCQCFRMKTCVLLIRILKFMYYKEIDLFVLVLRAQSQIGLGVSN